MNLIRAYKYLYYRIYEWQLKRFGKGDNPEFTALLGNSLLLFTNLVTLVIFFEIITGRVFRIENSYAIIAMIIIIATNYYIFLYKNKFNTIISSFELESGLQKKSSTIWCLVYVTITLACFFGSIFILSSE